jgi:3-oxoacyl-[acyl-carrier-protein] synthase I
MNAMHFAPLVITQVAIVSSVGAGLNALLAALRGGTSGLRPCTFETVALPTYVGEVSGVDEVRFDPEAAGYDCRNNRLAQVALQQDGFADAVASAREKYGPARIGVFLGTSTSGIHESERAYRDRDPETGALRRGFDFARTHDTFSVADFVSSFLRLEGPALVVSAACSTTANTFGCAARMITAGLCDAAIVGGADSLCLTTLYGFHSLEVLSPVPCRPFDAERDGISIGEGAGFALLEKPEAARDEDAVLLLGVGESSEAFHMSTPHPSGIGARLAMERALDAAGLGPSDIDYVNVHGTATRIGDAAEDTAINSLFGNRIPCSSTKGYTGHMLGAAGISEAIISILALRHGFVPGTLNTRTVDPSFKSRYLMQTTDASLRTVMSNSLGFGGSNCSLIFGRVP